MFICSFIVALRQIYCDYIYLLFRLVGISFAALMSWIFCIAGTLDNSKIILRNSEKDNLDSYRKKIT